MIFISKEVYNNVLSGNDESLRNIVKNDINSDLLERLDREELNLIIPINYSHVDVSIVNSSDELDIEKLKNWREEYKNAIYN